MSTDMEAIVSIFCLIIGGFFLAFLCLKQRKPLILALSAILMFICALFGGILTFLCIKSIFVKTGMSDDLFYIWKWVVFFTWYMIWFLGSGLISILLLSGKTGKEKQEKEKGK